MLRRFFARLGQLETPPPWGLNAGLISVIAAFAALVFGSNLTLTVYCSAPANAPYCQALNFAVPPSVWFLGWTLGAIALVAFIFITRRTPAERAGLRLGGLDTSIFWVLLVSIGLAVTLDLIVIQFTTGALEPELQSLRQQQPETLTWMLAFLFMVLAQPVAEELVFRGILQPALRQNLGAWPGYLVASFTYAAFHLLAYSPATSTSDTLTYGFALP
ncbi:MAG TPA: type II CAAX endopeptidase family protein, partial [Phototrophicaceae bacterium]|nr:type II CAAX endopeptidase family protein [Phototrophicaceae bacterium]